MPTLAFPLTTERLSLRPFVESDLDAMHAIYGREAVSRYLDWPPQSRDDVAALLGRIRPMTGIGQERAALRLAVLLTGALVGDVSLWCEGHERHQAEIGFVFHPDVHRRGYATEAMREMLRLGFAVFGFHRISGRCDARNAASAGLMERLGMRREAHFREDAFIKGVWTDLLVYAVLVSEWRPAS